MRYFCPPAFFCYIFYYYYSIDAVCVLRSKRRRHTQYIGQKYPGPGFFSFFLSFFLDFIFLFLIYLIILLPVFRISILLFYFQMICRVPPRFPQLAPDGPSCPQLPPDAPRCPQI